MRRTLFNNLHAYSGDVWLITVTAPGADVLPWDGRKVELASAHEWNRTAQKRWSNLHRWAYQAVYRESGLSPVSLVRAWQMQRRGVLHLHLVLGVGTPQHRAAARSYVDRLRQRNVEFGFGFVDARDRDGRAGRSTVMEPARAAGYLSKYLGESSQLTAAIAARARPTRLVWISPALTLATRCTMRRLRRARHLWAYRRRLCAPPVWAIADPVELFRVGRLLDGWVVAGQSP